ncbi:uncharacterized protein Ecym_5034 [Eremothecium cymbalariae DBVPG|uniref:JmjC domain-containing protein n=1 Tax=Eremothecium cymbalariae (strain CBS 270.75 / DBVPG 7215 / KCTC 17166 / NRRL Y-17582) TaxID=931890 RepID=I6NCP2_ERECY|nr:hypothetical protein Ecym_5034 [Eremothecium cymbalariae DBVPG\
MPKRVIEIEEETSRNKRSVDIDAKIVGGYEGYVPEERETEIDEIDEPLSEQEMLNFHKSYVVGRKPCKIRIRNNRGYDWQKLSSGTLLETLSGEQLLQVEQKVDGGFGSGKKRLKMTLKEFIERLSGGDNELYLTTQYIEDDLEQESEEDESDFSVASKCSRADAEGTEIEANPDDTDNEGDNSETFITAIENISGEGDGGDGGDDDASSDTDDIDGIKDDYDALFSTEEPIAQLSTGPLHVEEANQRVRELYQAPLTSVIHSLPPPVPEFLPYLLPQQINLWVGRISPSVENHVTMEKYNPSDPRLGFGSHLPSGGTSSGLHHDHADNLYIPIEGHKCFTLFSPADAIKMYTKGDVCSVLKTGIINYQRNENAPLWRELREDGAIVAEVAAHRLKMEADSLSPTEKEQLQAIVDKDEEEPKVTENVDPPHFSHIPVAAVHVNEMKDLKLQNDVKQEIERRWPLFSKANRITVNLRPGEMLWLPAGWFHEVTSFGSNKNNFHVAANYWFIPPNGPSIDTPYPLKDKYWPLDYERTKASLHYYRSNHLHDVPAQGPASNFM